MAHNPTRRAFMAGTVAIVPAVSLIGPAEALPIGDGPVDRRPWEAALAAFQQSEADFHAAIDACAAANEAFRVWLRANPEPMGIIFVENGKPVPPEMRGQISAERHDRWRQACAEIQAKLAVDDLSDKESEAAGRFLDALDAALTCPAPDIAAVAIKIELATKHDAALDDVQADLRRFSALGNGGTSHG